MDRYTLTVWGEILIFLSALALVATTILWVAATFGIPGFLVCMFALLIIGLVMVAISKED